MFSMATYFFVGLFLGAGALFGLFMLTCYLFDNGARIWANICGVCRNVWGFFRSIPEAVRYWKNNGRP